MTGWPLLRSWPALLLHGLLLLGFLYHSWTWFNIMPRTLPPIRVRGCSGVGGHDHRHRPDGGAGGQHRGFRADREVGIMKRSNAPIFWLLFGAGGMLSALIGAVLVFSTGLAAPLGLLLPADAFSYDRVLGFAQSWLGQAQPVGGDLPVSVAQRAPHLPHPARSGHPRRRGGQSCCATAARWWERWPRYWR